MWRISRICYLSALLYLQLSDYLTADCQLSAGADVAQDVHTDSEELAGLQAACKDWVALSGLLVREVAEQSLQESVAPPATARMSAPTARQPRAESDTEDAKDSNEEEEEEDDNADAQFVTLALDGSLVTQRIPSYAALKRGPSLVQVAAVRPPVCRWLMTCSACGQCPAPAWPVAPHTRLPAPSAPLVPSTLLAPFPSCSWTA